MKEYYLELEESNSDQAIEALQLFEKLGYKPDVKWNKVMLEKEMFDCVICFPVGMPIYTITDQTFGISKKSLSNN